MTIAEAEKCLQAGDVAGAKEVLLKAAYIDQLDETAQETYLTRIPIGDALQERLDGVLQQAQEGDVAARAKALAAIAKEAARTVNKTTHEWIRDPRVTDVLIAAMASGKAKLVNEAAGAAILIINRYFADRRLRPAFLPLLKNRNKTVRRHACNALQALFEADSVPLLTGMLTDKAEEVRGQVCIVLGSLAMKGHLSAEQRQAVLPGLTALLRDADVQIRTRASAALWKLGEPAAKAALQAALTEETVPLVREALEDAVRELS